MCLLIGGGVDSSGSGNGQVVGFYECGNEHKINKKKMRSTF